MIFLKKNIFHTLSLYSNIITYSIDKNNLSMYTIKSRDRKDNNKTVKCFALS